MLALTSMTYRRPSVCAKLASCPDTFGSKMSFLQKCDIIFGNLLSVQFPGILQEESESKKQEVDYSGMSCAEIALVDEQGLSINPAIAATAAAMLMKLLVTKDLQHHCAYVSIDSGTTFVYNSSRILTDYLQKMEFVSVEEAEEYDDQEDMEQAMLDEEDDEELLFEEDLEETAEAAIGLA